MLIKSFTLSASVVLPWVLSSLYNVQKTSLETDARPPSNHKERIIRDSKLISITVPTTYYVSSSTSTASDSNSGLSTSSPFKTIQRAADLTNPGDTVLIMNGVYKNAYPQGQVILITRSGTANAWIKFKAYPGHSPKLQHNGWDGISIQKGASYIEVNGLDVAGNNANVNLDYALSQRTNTSNTLTSGNCISIDGRYNGHPHHIRILNNKVHDCGGVGISAIQSDYITVDRNEVFNNAWYSVYATSGISLYQNWNSDHNQSYKMFVTNNKVYNNRQYVPWIVDGTIADGNGIIIDDSRNTQNNSKLGVYKGRTLVANNLTFNNGGSGIHTYMSEHVDIVHNTAYMNNQSPEIQHGQLFANESSDIKILNNILYAYPGKKMNMDWKNINVTYDYNIYANGTSISVLGYHDIIGNPQFVNPSIADFRLKATSPAINSGYTWKDLTTDFVGKSRPSGTGYDRGAYEYQY